MSYILKPSLQDIAVNKIAVTLWNTPDVRASLSKASVTMLEIPENEERWLLLEKKVIEAVSLLLLPESLKRKLLAVIRPVGLQILGWLQFHASPYYDLYLPQELCWKPCGIVDRKRTAEMLLKDVNLDITARFKLSCIYCLEDSIQELWSEMDENTRKSFDVGKQQELVTLWTNIMSGKPNRPYTPICTLVDVLENRRRRRNRRRSRNQCIFECASCAGNVVATEYYFQKLRPNERNDSLLQAAATVAQRRVTCKSTCEFLKDYATETLCFLLKIMDEAQKIALFKKKPLEVMLCLLDWPWHVFFMETESVVQKYLSAEAYKILLDAILLKLKKSPKDSNYEKILRDIWLQSSHVFKRYILNQNLTTGNQLFVNLFLVRDKINLKLIFHDATFKQKKALIYSHNGLDIFNDLINEEEWCLLDYFIRECITSKEDMMIFKKHFIEFGIGSWSKKDIVQKQDKLYKCFQLLDDILCEFDKRKLLLDENHLPPSPKRPCTSNLDCESSDCLTAHTD